MGWKRDRDLETQKIKSAGGEGGVSSPMALALEKEGFPRTQQFSALATSWNQLEIFQHVPRLGPGPRYCFSDPGLGLGLGTFKYPPVIVMCGCSGEALEQRTEHRRDVHLQSPRKSSWWTLPVDSWE